MINVDTVFQFLLSIMPELHAHIFKDHRSTLLSRYLGIYSIWFQVPPTLTATRFLCHSHQTDFRIPAQGAKINFVVMENVAHHRKGRLSSQYDLKGSWCDGFSCVLHQAPTLTTARVSRQVLQDSAAVRRQFESGCKRHEGTLKDLDMALLARVPCISSSIH